MKMNKPLFSIIIATYKRPRLLERALRSVLDQTFRDFECIVVDDAGDAGTAQIARQFEDNRIVLVQHTQNRGAAAAYNTGINASRGALIAILDDDDEYYPAFLEKMQMFFREAPAGIGFAWTGIRRVMDTPEGERLLYDRIWPAAIQPKEAAYVAATTIGNGFGLTMRKECIDAVGLYNETFRVCEDTEHLFRLARRFEFATIPEVLVKIHHHADGQLTHQDMDKQRLELHERILRENAGFVARYPELNFVHVRRLAEMYYSLKMKRQGGRALLGLWKKMPCRVSIFVDLCCYTLYGVNAATLWKNSKIRRYLHRA